jgi:hypothetical protein
MFAKGVIVFIEDRPARGDYLASTIITVSEARSDGKPVNIDVMTDKGHNGRKVGDKCEINVAVSGTKTGGIFIRER